MDLKDQYRNLIGAYFGIREMDDYELKVYVLKDLEKYIKDFIKTNPIDDFNYRKEASLIEDNLSLKRKLQDALLYLNKTEGNIELILMIKKKIKEINHLSHKDN